ncbi:MAG: DUF342 domain-containing protein [Ignavibacteriales bacterium]
MSNPAEDAQTSSFLITVSRDRMEVYLTLNLAGDQGVSPDKIFAELTARQITHGLDVLRIRDLCTSGKPCNEEVIATGNPPVSGHDAEIDYHFGRPIFEPQLTEDGKADYYELGKITLINKGEVIAVKATATPGEPGINVYGETVSPQSGRDKRFLVGKGVTVEGGQAVATYDGALNWEGNKVGVTNVYMVPGDVDFSIGNIKFSGKVLINGSIKDGFKVHAEGDIEVQGMVENCELISDSGSIFVKGGILGKNKALLTAARNIEAKFIQEATVEAGRHIIVNEYILRSTLNAGDSVLIQGFRGRILGENNITAKTKIKANMIRSDKGVNLLVQGIDRTECYNRMKQVNETIESEDQVMRALALKARLLTGKKDAASLALITETLQKYIKVTEELESLKDERQHLMYMLNSTKGEGMIEVRGQTDAGLFLRIKTDSVMLKNSLRNVTLYFDHEDKKIVMVGLK